MLKASNNNITNCGDLSQLTGQSLLSVIVNNIIINHYIGLLALILNNNQLTTLTGLNKLSHLNTLG